MSDLMPFLMNGRWLAAAIVAFGAMIFFHELGHFLMAKRAGVTVYAFRWDSVLACWGFAEATRSTR